jgi:hypothetical protein
LAGYGLVDRRGGVTTPTVGPNATETATEPNKGIVGGGGTLDV